jgi:hypothetical protein
LRSITFPLLLIFPCLMLSAQTQTPPQSQPSPSLQETIKWIQEKVQTNGGYKQHVDIRFRNNSQSTSVDFESKYISVKSDESGCGISAFVRETTKSSVNSSPNIQDGNLEISLSHARPGSVKASWYEMKVTSEYPGADYTYSPKGYYRVTADPFEKDSSVSTAIDNVLFSFLEESTANRVATALNHAVELCRANAKPEPF